MLEKEAGYRKGNKCENMAFLQTHTQFVLENYEFAQGRVRQTNMTTFVLVTVAELTCLDTRKILISLYEIFIVKQKMVANASHT